MLFHRELLVFSSLAVVYVALAAGSLTMAAEPARPTAKQVIASPRTLVIGHRGASGSAPENTLPAFRLALAAKPDMVELDYYHSSDGIPFVFHDSTLDRTTNAVVLGQRRKTAPTSLSWSQLQRFDAGSWYNAKFAGTHIPTLDESLDTIQAGSVTLIERKGGDAQTVVDLLKRKKLLDQVVVQAFDWDYLADCHRLAPELVLGALGSKQLGPQQLAEIQQTGAQAVGWNYKDIGAAEVERVHAAKLKLWVYTVNDADQMRRLIKLGIDGLITDHPALARRIVDEAP